MQKKTAVSEKQGDLDTHLFGIFYIPPITRTLCAYFFWALGIAYAAQRAYHIRLYSLTDFGMVIHEFDPWFNYRATEYLSQHGWHAFFHWYDYMSWSPLGRPVGTTIYPGLQITSVVIHRLLEYMGHSMSLNDVCCMVPAWFGTVASLFLGLLTYECSGSGTSGTLATIIMAIIPAHIMRSVGGGYDNESIAMTAMCATFYFWVRSLRSRSINTNSSAWVFGVLTGLAYGYMVAAWGGYIFVLNMIALHAGALVAIDWARGHWSSQLHYSYSLFFVIGTFLATLVPPVGMSPFKSLEQLAAFAVFVGMQILWVSEFEREKLGEPIVSKKGFRIRMKWVGIFFGVAVVMSVILLPTGFFGPLSSRVRGLFVQHMKTGNPLVDSVAEHQPGTPESFWQFLHIAYYLSPWGFGVIFFHNFRQSSFILLTCIVVQFFALKMSRLIILAAVPVSSLAGMAIGMALDCVIADCFIPEISESENKVQAVAPAGKKGKKVSESTALFEIFSKWKTLEYRRYRIMLFVAFAFIMVPPVRNFFAHSEAMARNFSHNSLMFKHNENGREVMIDDYRDAYFWLRDKTPEDSRVLAWWDYGYQITGIGNRTTIADGNTWNHEHIATIGRCLTSPVAQAHAMIRHLADYVLVWSGGGGDDLGKSPWMARIGNSVYRDICPNDPLCDHFGFRPGPQGEVQGGEQNREPTPMMAKSLLYNIHSAGRKPGIGPNPKYFTEAYTSKYGLIRIFKVMNVSEESKKFTADPANRICDAPGSWYCTGQYPPAEELQEVLRRKKSFKQLEDFNAKKNEDDDFSDQYLKRSLGDGHAGYGH
jgi:dolichyl-diphosphooligosaccharide--protein glycosyltransferase